MKNRIPRHVGAPVALAALASLAACATSVDSPESAATQSEAFTYRAFSENPPGNGTYELRGLGNKCLDVGGAPFLAGDAVTLYLCNGSIAQQIRIVETAPMSMVYTLQAGDKCIAPAGNNTSTSSTPLRLAVCDGSAAQRFVVTGYTGHWQIQSNVSTTMVFDVRGGQTANLTPIQLYPKNGTASQSWAMNPLEIPGAVPKSPLAREGRATVHDHRGGRDTTTTVATLEYEDQSNTETGYTFWMESFGPNWMDQRPWAQVGSAPSVSPVGTVRYFLPQLEAGRVYFVAARAVNDAGASTPGIAFINTMTPNPPENPSLSDVTSSSMVLHFESPSGDADRVDGFHVRYGSTTIDVPNPSETTWQHQQTISGLAAGTNYCFQISSYNALWGESAPITQCGMTMVGSTPPPPPKWINLQATLADTNPEFPTVNDSIEFSWSECNLGNLAAGAHDWAVLVEPAEGGTYTAQSGTVPSLAAQTCINMAVTVGELPEGRFVLEAVVDTGNAVMESSKDDNRTSDVIDVSSAFVIGPIGGIGGIGPIRGGTVGTKVGLALP